MKYGLVLAGGGVRGAYQIGVIKALAELGIEISAVCGTSIGAINGALFVQDGGSAAEKLWREIRPQDIVKISGKEKENLLSFSNLPEIIKKLSDGGLDISPMENLLKGLIDEEKIRSSPVDFGMVSISLTNKKAVRLFKNDIPDGEIYSYLIAGASLPVFGTKEIDGEYFTDGGMADNMPVQMLIDKGIKDIITVDVHGIGRKRDVCEAGINLIEIKCLEPHTGILDFNREGIAKSIDLGYYETKKTFGCLCGKKYFFDVEEYISLRKIYGQSLLEGLEDAAEIFGVDRLCSYEFKDFAVKTLGEYRKICRKYKKSSLSGFYAKTACAAVLHLINLIKEGNNEFIKKKLDVFGKYYSAASALIYFEQKF